MIKPPESSYFVLRRRRTYALIFVGLFLCVLSMTAHSYLFSSKLFPKPPAIEKDVHFWKQVYTQISTSEGFIHDNADLSVVYETIKIPSNLGYKARSRYTKKYKTKYKKILDTLSRAVKKNSKNDLKSLRLSKEEKRVLALWPENVTYKELNKAKKRIRFQLGQANKFKAGLIRSGRWKPYILSILKEMDLPLEIAALPHVESSFNYKAYSKVGAAGMWQFTRSTGRRYMRVDHVLDERLDPFIATRSAARLLKNNYAVTGTWPMAMTAYNHGAAGMRRAAKKLGTTDIAIILRRYKSRSFGFASRNFYPSFLAAVEISQQPDHYFKNIKLDPPVDFELIPLVDFISAETIIDALKIDRLAFMSANPALRPAVLDGNKYIPKSYKLRVDRSLTDNIARVLSGFVNIPEDKRFALQKPDRYHRVTRGQTLSIIAARYGIRTNDLVASNNMRNKHIIRVGQVLILPQKSGSAPAKEIKVKEKNTPVQEPVAVASDGLYVVKKGDSLDRIAQRNAISVRQLLALNSLPNRNKIYPGQRLVLVKQEEISKQKKLVVAELEKTLLTTADNKIKAETAVKNIPEAFDTGELLAMTHPQEIEVVENEVLDASHSLLADPSDYSVSDHKMIEIQAAETLGHYAEWLQIKTRDLRRLNKMKYGKPVMVGKHLKLSFKKVTPDEFEVLRIQYHKNLQEAFFEKNQIVDTIKYRLNRGESIWRLTRKTYKIPFWLLRQYNPDLDMNRISADIIITFPKVKRHNI